MVFTKGTIELILEEKKRHPRPKEKTQDREDRLNEGITGREGVCKEETSCKIRSRILRGFVYGAKQLGIYPKGSGDSVKDFKYRDNMINKG